MSTRHIRRYKQASRGLSLIELMVALVIGTLLIAGAVTVYMQSRNTYRTSDTTARLQEVARYAMDIIEPDVRLAGFWGLTNRSEFVANAALSSAAPQAVDAAIGGNCGNNWGVNLAQFLDGRDRAVTGATGYSSTVSGTGYDLNCAGTNPVNWSDVLIVRRASSDPGPPTAGLLQIQTNRMRGEIFSSGIIPSGFNAAPASETRDLIVHAYYVSEILPSPNGVRQFSLRRKTLVGNGAAPAVQDQEVIPGVEDLQIQVGIDTNLDGNTDSYVNPPVAAGIRITTVRLWLRVIAEDREIGFVNSAPFSYANANFGAFNDDRRRVLITKTIQVRNSALPL